MALENRNDRRLLVTPTLISEDVRPQEHITYLLKSQNMNYIQSKVKNGSQVYKEIICSINKKELT